MREITKFCHIALFSNSFNNSLTWICQLQLGKDFWSLYLIRKIPVNPSVQHDFREIMQQISS